MTRGLLNQSPIGQGIKTRTRDGRETKTALSKNAAPAPVFIVGCPRSGTTLLYHILLSSGNFAVYLAETNVFNKLAPAFRSLKSLTNRRRMMEAWLKSDYFKRSGLQAEAIRSRILSDCRNPGDFLRILMESVARKQGMRRWAEKTPLHILSIPQIKKTIPDALIIHIIRDGRDVAVSLNHLGWASPFAWDRKHSLTVAGLYWEWLVRKGRKYGRRLGPDYMEVRFEDLLQQPQEVLTRLGAFIGDDLNYKHIRHNAVGTVVRPNSAFKRATDHPPFNPIGRWRDLGDSAQRLDRALAPLLRELGYQTGASESADILTYRLRPFYNLWQELRQRVRQTPLSTLLVHKEIIFRPGELDRQDLRWEAI